MRTHPTNRTTTALHAGPLAALLTAPALLTTGCGQTSPSEAAENNPAPEQSTTHAPAGSLETAIVQGDNDAVYQHILAGTPVNTTNAAGDTPLGIAAALGRTYAVEVLIGAGAELETKNNAGATPLFNAAFFCHADALKKLIEAGADTGVTDPNGFTILQVMKTPWDQIEPVYVMVHRAIGIPFDAARIERARPAIAEMLR